MFLAALLLKITCLFCLNKKGVKPSGMFMFLPSTLDRKEDFVKWEDHVHLHPVDVTIPELVELTGNQKINPAMLNSNDEREKVVDGYLKVMKKVAEISNQNLIRSSDAFLSSGGKTDSDNEFVWIDDSFKTGIEKFQLSY